MIRSYEDLFEEVTGRSANDFGYKECMARISHLLFKYTQCGISFYSLCEDGPITLAGYCEGVDIDCIPYTLNYPFSADEFWKDVDNADNDGIELWNDTHGCEHCYSGLEGEYDYTPIDPNCNHCHGEGVIL